jgi:hypothetical protein
MSASLRHDAAQVAGTRAIVQEVTASVLPPPRLQGKAPWPVFSSLFGEGAAGRWSRMQP